MATQKQIRAAKRNIKKAQKEWKKMSQRERALAQPQGDERAEIGTRGEGDYYRIIVRDKNQFTSFRYHDVGDEGHVQRLAGHRKSGSWDTHAWLISKEDAHIEDKHLVPDTDDAAGVLEQVGSTPQHERGDVFTAKPRNNVPEKDKPTPAQQKARKDNIEKAQQARWE